MSAALPDLYSTPLTSFIFCAHFPSDDADVLKWFGDADEMREARIDSDSGASYVQCILGRFSDGDMHFHLNMARESHFDGRPPKKNLSEISEVLEKISKGVGHTVTGWCAGFGSLPLTSLPDTGLVHVLAEITTEISNTPMTLTGATLSFGDNDLDELEWKIRGEIVKCNLRANVQDQQLTEDFLGNLVKRLCDGLNQFILEKEKS